MTELKREDLDRSIANIVANAMQEQAKLMASRVFGTIMVIMVLRSTFILFVYCAMVGKNHLLGAFLAAAIAAVYDLAQTSLYKEDYTFLSLYGCLTALLCYDYLAESGRAWHLCLLIFVIFALRCFQLRMSAYYTDVEDILSARKILLRDGIEDHDKVVVTTRTSREYVYEWDRAEVETFIRQGGVVPGADAKAGITTSASKS